MVRHHDCGEELAVIARIMLDAIERNPSSFFRKNELLECRRRDEKDRSVGGIMGNGLVSGCFHESILTRAQDWALYRGKGL